MFKTVKNESAKSTIRVTRKHHVGFIKSQFQFFFHAIFAAPL